MNRRVLALYKTDLSLHQAEILKNFTEPTQQEKIKELFQSIVFKLEKNLYHLNNISHSIEKASEKNDFLSLMQLYFELENFLISTRSSVDMVMHLINYCLDLNIDENTVAVSTVYRSKKLPKPMKDIFNRYTTPYNNPTWSFIYLLRNEVVHEKSIYQVLPIYFKPVLDTNFLYMKTNSGEKEMLDHLKVCLRFLDTFVDRVLSILAITSAKK